MIYFRHTSTKVLSLVVMGGFWSTDYKTYDGLLYEIHTKSKEWKSTHNEIQNCIDSGLMETFTFRSRIDKIQSFMDELIERFKWELIEIEE